MPRIEVGREVSAVLGRELFVLLGLMCQRLEVETALHGEHRAVIGLALGDELPPRRQRIAASVGDERVRDAPELNDIEQLCFDAGDDVLAVRGSLSRPGSRAPPTRTCCGYRRSVS